MTWQQYGEHFSGVPGHPLKMAADRLLTANDIFAGMPPDVLLNIDGQPGQGIRQAVIVGAGELAFRMMLQSAEMAEGQLCPAGIRYESGVGAQLALFPQGFGEVHEQRVRLKAEARHLENPLTAAFWIGDRPFQAGLGFYDLAAKKFHLLSGAVTLDWVNISQVPAKTPLVRRVAL